MTADHANCTVIAHNGDGFVNKFVLKYCNNRALEPDQLIRQMTKITYMHFRQLNIRFVDSWCVFASSLRSLPSTFDIDTSKGFFPQFFSRP